MHSFLSSTRFLKTDLLVATRRAIQLAERSLPTLTPRNTTSSSKHLQACACTSWDPCGSCAPCLVYPFRPPRSQCLAYPSEANGTRRSPRAGSSARVSSSRCVRRVSESLRNEDLGKASKNIQSSRKEGGADGVGCVVVFPIACRLQILLEHVVI